MSHYDGDSQVKWLLPKWNLCAQQIVSLHQNIDLLCFTSRSITKNKKKNSNLGGVHRIEVLVQYTGSENTVAQVKLSGSWLSTEKEKTYFKNKNKWVSDVLLMTMQPWGLWRSTSGYVQSELK